MADLDIPALVARLQNAAGPNPRFYPDLTCREAADVLEAQAREIERLTALVHVPGMWNCPKCHFVLTQSNLNATDGTITARDDPGDKCPNCATPLWRLTWKEHAQYLGARAEQEVIENAALRAKFAGDDRDDDWIEEALQDAVSNGEGRLFARYFKDALSSRGLQIVRGLVVSAGRKETPDV